MSNPRQQARNAIAESTTGFTSTDGHKETEEDGVERVRFRRTHVSLPP